MKKQKIILDCDPGHDDAIAILLAAKAEQIELLGITVVSGNQRLSDTVKNTLNICQALDIHVPVYAGCEKPIIRQQVLTAETHGMSGLSGFAFTHLTRNAEKENGVSFIVNTLLKSEGHITVVTTGPMTNLAMAIKKEPRVVKKIKRIVLMGGSYSKGNITPTAEFNIFADAEAADICFVSGIPITMIGLDVTRQVLCDDRIINRMQKVQTRASKFFVEIMKHSCKLQKEIFGAAEVHLHDPVTIAYLMDPSVLKVQPMYSEVEIRDEQLYGKTHCDMFDYQKKKHNTDVATGIDVARFWDIIERELESSD